VERSQARERLEIYGLNNGRKENVKEKRGGRDKIRKKLK